MTNRTNLERYQAITIQMLMARADGRNEDPYLDKLDELHKLLSEEEIKFINGMSDWGTHYWCPSCSMAHLNTFKCPKAPTCEGCGIPTSYTLCHDCFESGEFQ